MKKYILTIIAITLATINLSATTIRTGEIVTIEKNEVINDNLIVAAKRVKIKGIVHGDVNLLAGDALILGQVDGDINAIGGKLIILTPKVSDIRALGINIDLNGSTQGDVYLAGGDITLGKHNIIGKELIAVGGQIVAGGKVKGNAQLRGGIIQLDEGALFERDLTCATGAKGPRISSTAHVGGTLNIVQQSPHHRHKKTQMGGFMVVLRFINILASAILALVMILLMPNYVRSVSKQMIETPLKSMLTGLTNVFVTPIIILICLVSVIGIPIGLILLAFYTMGIYSTNVFVSFWVGGIVLKRWRPQDKENMVKVMVLGLFLYAIVINIPYIGWIINIIGMLIAMGALSNARTGIIAQMRSKQII